MRVPLAAVPAQRFTIEGASRWQLTLRVSGDYMYADVDRDGARMLSGVRVIYGTPLMPYPTGTRENFYFLTTDDAEVFYTDFGDRTRLYFEDGRA